MDATCWPDLRPGRHRRRPDTLALRLRCGGHRHRPGDAPERGARNRDDGLQRVEGREERRLEVFFEQATIEITAISSSGQSRTPSSSTPTHRNRAPDAGRTLRRESFATRGVGHNNFIFYQYVTEHTFPSAPSTNSQPATRDFNDALPGSRMDNRSRLSLGHRRSASDGCTGHPDASRSVAPGPSRSVATGRVHRPVRDRPGLDRRRPCRTVTPSGAGTWWIRRTPPDFEAGPRRRRRRAIRLNGTVVVV